MFRELRLYALMEVGEKDEDTRACSGPFSASRVWWWGSISSLTLSAALAKNCVASASVQYSMLVPSMDRIWSPTCNAPHQSSGQLL